MKLEFLKTTRDGQEVCALLFYENGKIWGKPVGNGNEILVKSILADHVRVKDKIIRREDDPEAWFRGLPDQYNGSHFCAIMVSDDPSEASEQGCNQLQK